GQLVPVGGLDQRLAGREVPVQRPDADSRLLGDRIKRHVRAVLAERAGGHRQRAAAAMRRSRLRGAPARRGRDSVAATAPPSVATRQRRILRFSMVTTAPKLAGGPKRPAVILALCSARTRSTRSSPTASGPSATRSRLTSSTPARTSSGPSWPRTVCAATTPPPGPSR